MCVVGDDWTSAVQRKSNLLMTTLTNDTDNVRWELKTYTLLLLKNDKLHTIRNSIIIYVMSTGYSESLRLRSDGCSISPRKAITV